MESRNLSRTKEVSGLFPEYGAIFMSNKSTLKECFEKRLLGLPSSRSDFVGGVKAGMILFLFESEERKLYGVFEAISDGGMNIVPRAYASSGKWFPAQVKFTTIWHCDPLYEDEFRDAIRDNYYETYKFNFGLSKDQIQSLLWLFNSRKLKIPKCLHHNRRKNSKWHYKSLKGGLKKEKFDKIEISGGKPSMDACISVIAEVERHSVSSDSCRKSEIIRFDPDAYDPGHPGFHHLAEFEAHCAAGHETHEVLAIQEKKENFQFSANDTEEYIPLFSPDHSDPEKEGFDFDEDSGEKQIEKFIGNSESFFPIPLLPVGLDDFSSAVLPLSDANDFQSKDGSNHSKAQLSKGMYSDSQYKRTSVFSRLNFSSKDMAKGNRKDECGKMDKVKPKKHEIEDCNVNKGTSVFVRLTSPSYAVAQEVHCMTGMEQGTFGRKKRKNDNICSSERRGMLASEYDMEADGFKEDMSVPEILENLWHRHADWMKMVGKTDFLGQTNEYDRMDKKGSVLSRLSVATSKQAVS